MVEPLHQFPDLWFFKLHKYVTNGRKPDFFETRGNFGEIDNILQGWLRGGSGVASYTVIHERCYQNFDSRCGYKFREVLMSVKTT